MARAQVAPVGAALADGKVHPGVNGVHAVLEEEAGLLGVEGQGRGAPPSAAVETFSTPSIIFCLFVVLLHTHHPTQVHATPRAPSSRKSFLEKPHARAQF